MTFGFIKFKKIKKFMGPRSLFCQSLYISDVYMIVTDN